MRRVVPYTVAAALEMAWRRAATPVTISPLGMKPTIDGKVRSPVLDSMTWGTPLSSRTATHEFDVPRSMPMMRDIVIPFSPRAA